MSGLNEPLTRLQFLNIVVFSSLVYFCPTIVNGLGYTSIQA
jgi:hypothetical protein